MTWQLVDDVWALIAGELGDRERGRLAQVHPFFRRILKKHSRYQWLDYRGSNDTVGKIFYRACTTGFLGVAQSLRATIEHEEEGKDLSWHGSKLIAPFSETFERGHMSVIEWLWSIYGCKRKPILFEVLTLGNKTILVQWVWQKNQKVPVRERARLWENKQFFTACVLGHLEMAQLLYAFNPSKMRLNQAFRHSMRYSEISRWLYSVKPRVINPKSFIWACQTGELTTAQWMFRLQTFDPTILQQAIQETRQKSYPAVVLWLKNLLPN